MFVLIPRLIALQFIVLGADVVLRRRLEPVDFVQWGTLGFVVGAYIPTVLGNIVLLAFVSKTFPEAALFLAIVALLDRTLLRDALTIVPRARK